MKITEQKLHEEDTRDREDALYRTGVDPAGNLFDRDCRASLRQLADRWFAMTSE